MDLRLAHLRSLVAVVEEGHFGRAARMLGLSQPQVTRQIRALEDELGLVLLDRTARRTQLTPGGRAVLPAVRDALDAAARVRSAADAAPRGAADRVAVGFIWSTLAGYLGPLVAAVNGRHPAIDISVRQLRWLEILPALRHRSVDLVIGRTMHESSEMVAETIADEPSMLVVAEDHPFAGRRTIALTELDGEPVIALHRSLSPVAYDAVSEAARKAGIERRVVQHAASPQEAIALAGAGIGVYRLPGSAVTPRAGVALVEILGASSPVWLIRRPDPPSPALLRVIDCAREIVPFTPTPDVDRPTTAATTGRPTPG
ncbi:MAG TPA: LysR family transcriptional regulator [Solirubrobacteraceae bacterium]|jgi:DNA-binding transcriptional LysR family regulator|nr:LysR family transcriptional regulator [Solirubrobacteraceae bacterium]